MTEKKLPHYPPDFPRETVQWLRERAEGHAPGHDIAIYARPSTILGLADLIESRGHLYDDAQRQYEELRAKLEAVLGR